MPSCLTPTIYYRSFSIYYYRITDIVYSIKIYDKYPVLDVCNGKSADFVQLLLL